MAEVHAGDDIRDLTRVVLRPLGSALPMGFYALAVGMALSCALELKLIPASATHSIALVMLAFVAPLELIPSVLAFFSRDTAGATLLGVFSMSWVCTALIWLTTPPGSLNPALGILAIALGVVVLLMAVVALPVKPFFSTLLFVAGLRFGVMAWRNLGGGQPLETLAGVIAGVLWLFGIYGGTALLIEDVRQKPVLPVFRRGAAKRSFEGDLREQLERLEREAGVRQQL